MARKIGIIGMGNVGAAIHGAIAQGLADSYVFIDINERKVEADAPQDFKDAMANLANYANIVVNDYEALKDANVVCIFSSWKYSATAQCW